MATSKANFTDRGRIKERAGAAIPTRGVREKINARAVALYFACARLLFVPGLLRDSWCPRALRLGPVRVLGIKRGNDDEGERAAVHRGRVCRRRACGDEPATGNGIPDRVWRAMEPPAPTTRLPLREYATEWGVRAVKKIEPRARTRALPGARAVPRVVSVLLYGRRRRGVA